MKAENRCRDRCITSAWRSIIPGGRDTSVPTSLSRLIAIRFTLHPIVGVGAFLADIVIVVARKIVLDCIAVAVVADSVGNSIVAHRTDRSVAAVQVDSLADRDRKIVDTVVHSGLDRLAAVPAVARVGSTDTVAVLDLPDSSY